VCISWTIKCLILLVLGATMKFNERSVYRLIPGVERTESADTLILAFEVLMYIIYK